MQWIGTCSLVNCVPRHISAFQKSYWLAPSAPAEWQRQAVLGFCQAATCSGGAHSSAVDAHVPHRCEHGGGGVPRTRTPPCPPSTYTSCPAPSYLRRFHTRPALWKGVYGVCFAMHCSTIVYQNKFSFSSIRICLLRVRSFVGNNLTVYS